MEGVWIVVGGIYFPPRKNQNLYANEYFSPFLGIPGFRNSGNAKPDATLGTRLHCPVSGRSGSPKKQKLRYVLKGICWNHHNLDSAVDLFRPEINFS